MTWIAKFFFLSPLTGKMAAVGPSIPVVRIELPTYYLVFIFLVIWLVVWGIIKIFGHAEHSHDQEH